MIRLSTAHAKARLSKSIDMVDAQAAVELIQFACFKKVRPRNIKELHRVFNIEYTRTTFLWRTGTVVSLGKFRSDLEIL